MIRGTIVVAENTCKGCELCIVACPQDCIQLSDHLNVHGYRYATLKNDTCTGCVNCALVCPDAAITVYRQPKAAPRAAAVAMA